MTISKHDVISHLVHRNKFKQIGANMVAYNDDVDAISVFFGNGVIITSGGYQSIPNFDIVETPEVGEAEKWERILQLVLNKF